MNFNHKKLQQYEYIKEIGSGGQGTVHKIKEKRKERYYALKILTNNANANLFEKEIETLKKIQHNNIISMYEFSLGNAQEESFILMEYMKHGNISEYLSNNKQSSLYSKLLFIQEIAQALQYIHKQGYIHRDIKPKNIFITNDTEGDPYACLGDFGIAKQPDVDTETEGGKGTRLYLPLEVLRGEAEHSKQTDIYGLGMSMYEILVGKHPSKNYVDYMDHLINDIPFDKPSKHNSQLNSDIDNICIKAIAPKEENRYQYIKDFIQDLESYITTISQQENKQSQTNFVNEQTTKTKSQEYSNLNNKLTPQKKKVHHKVESLFLTTILVSFLGFTIYAFGHEHPFITIGHFYKIGILGEENLEEAIKWYKKAPDHINSELMISLGYSYEYGSGIEQDYAKAVQWYIKAADQGNTNVLETIASLYRNGGPGLQKNIKKAIKWYTKSAKWNNQQAMVSLGDIYSFNEDDLPIDNPKAIKWYTDAAKLGNTYAMERLGDLNQSGGNGIEQNMEVALEWYTKAAYLDNKIAMATLGDIYSYNVDGIPIDYKKAKRWYKSAANLEYDYAMKRLGDLMWYGGHGIEQNTEAALDWYTKAAYLDNEEAMVSLGNIYSYNQSGIPIDHKEAKKWYAKAVEYYEIAIKEENKYAQLALDQLLKSKEYQKLFNEND